MNIYKNLVQIVNEYNKKYEDINNRERELLESDNLDSEIIEKVRHRKWQLIHDYATLLSNEIIMNIDNLQKKDSTVFDLVPYNVWAKIPIKTRIAVQILRDL